MSSPYIVDQGHKPVVSGARMAASTGNPVVTETVMEILAAGGNAADAAIAGALVQAVVEPHLTSHAGMVSCLYWDEQSGTAHQLNALGTIAPDLAPFRPVNGVGGWAREGAPGPQAAIPGFMPGLATLHENSVRCHGRRCANRRSAGPTLATWCRRSSMGSTSSRRRSSASLNQPATCSCPRAIWCQSARPCATRN